MSFVDVADKTIYRFRFRFRITPPTLSSIKVLKPPHLGTKPENMQNPTVHDCLKKSVVTFMLISRNLLH